MYRGFDLHIKPKDFLSYYQIGLSLYEEAKVEARKSLDNFLLPDGQIDADQLQEHWFPQINADIFISHYHDQEELAIAFAGWLNKNFELKCFIDSCIWKHCDDLLLRIDNRFNTKISQSTFNYKERNYSTSHVHMMLQIALTQMIDHCECLFFLNKPEMINAGDVIRSTM